MLTNSSILAQPENNSADRQIYMIIVITNNKGCIQAHIIFTVCSVFSKKMLKCVSDLSKYCVHIGERSRKRRFPHFKSCCMRTEL